MTAYASGRRDVILDAAGRLFGARGYHATSLVDVATEAGVTKQAIYYHFDGKEALLVELHDRIVVDAVRWAQGTIERETDSAVTLERILEHHVAMLLRNVDANLTLNRERGALSAESESRLRARERDYEEMLRSVYRSGVADGLFRDVDPTLAVGTLLGACNWAYQWFRPGHGMGVRRVARELSRLLAHGYRAGDGVTSNDVSISGPR